MTKYVYFSGDPAIPDIESISRNDRDRLESLIALAGHAKDRLTVSKWAIRKTFDRISVLHRFALANLPVRPDGKVLEVNLALQSEVLDENQKRDPAELEDVKDAITYWGNYIFAEAARRAAASSAQPK